MVPQERVSGVSRHGKNKGSVYCRRIRAAKAQAPCCYGAADAFALCLSSPTPFLVI